MQDAGNRNWFTVVERERLDNLLRDLSALKTGWPVAQSAEAQSRFSVAEDKFEQKLVLKQGEKALHTLYLGDSPAFRQLYVRTDNDDAIYKAPLNRFELSVDESAWLDKQLLRLPMVERIAQGDNLRQLGGKASGIALSMVLPDAARTSFAVVRDYQKAMRALGYQEFSARSFEGYVNARVLTEGLERAGRELTRAKLRSALAGIRSSDLGGLSIDYAGGAPYVGSRFLDLGVMGANGKFVG